MIDTTSFTKIILIRISLLIVSLFVVSGCKHAQNPQPLSGPSHSHPPNVSLKLFQGETSGMKVTGVNITALPVDEHGNPQGGPEASVTIPNPNFPLDVPLEVYVPPCNYQIMVSASLNQGGTRIEQATANACEDADVYMTIDSFSEAELPLEGTPAPPEGTPAPPEGTPAPPEGTPTIPLP